MRPICIGLLFALFISLASGFADTKAKPSKGLAFSAGVISALSAGLATYFTTGDLGASVLIGSTSGSVTSAMQYNSKRYTNWISQKYSWEKTSRQGILTNFIKRAAVGLVITGGVALVATLPGIGLDTPPPYTWQGLENVIRSSLAMTYFSTPVNMALSLLAKKKVENPSPFRKRLVELVSFLVNGVQSASTAAAIGEQATVATSINAALAAAGGVAWGVQSKKKCGPALEKISKSN